MNFCFTFKCIINFLSIIFYNLYEQFHKNYFFTYSKIKNDNKIFQIDCRVGKNQVNILI